MEKEAIQKKLESLAKERYENQRKTRVGKWTFWTELAIMVASLSIVPLLIITVLIIWP